MLRRARERRGYIEVYLPRPVFACNSSIFFEASALVSLSLKCSPASRQSVCRYERCGPVIGSSPVVHSSGSFSGFCIASVGSSGVIKEESAQPQRDRKSVV